MNRFLLVCGLGFTIAIVSCVNTPVSPAKATEYSLALAEPYPSEVQLASRRLQRFLQNPNARARVSLKETPFVAIQVGQYLAGEVPVALARIQKGTAQAVNSYSSDPLEPAMAQLQYLIVFDSRDGRQVGPVGFFVNDTPERGGIGKFGGIVAVYAGTG
jgi:hypothetical protein